MRLKWMHLLVAILLFASNLVYTKDLSVNVKVFEKLAAYITVPVYFFLILQAQEALRHSHVPVHSSIEGLGVLTMDAAMPNNFTVINE